MNNRMRKRIVALNLDEVANELDELLAEEQGKDGLRGHWKVRQALEHASGAISEVVYLATTPRKDWD